MYAWHILIFAAISLTLLLPEYSAYGKDRVGNIARSPMLGSGGVGRRTNYNNGRGGRSNAYSQEDGNNATSPNVGGFSPNPAEDDTTAQSASAPAEQASAATSAAQAVERHEQAQQAAETGESVAK